MKASFNKLISGVFMLVVSLGAHGTLITETADFGNTVTSAFTLPAGTTQVSGTVSNDNDGELLLFALAADQNVIFDLDFLTGDANLLLFNGAGNPLFGDDDGGAGFDSRISIFLRAGNYFIGVGENNFAGFDSGVNEIIDNDHGLCVSNPSCNENGVLSFIGNESDPLGPPSGSPHDWILSFSVATSAVSSVPAPASFSFVMLSLLWMIRRQRLRTVR